MGYHRSPSVTYDVLDGQAVLIHPESVEMLTLNRVGTLVWERLDGTMDPPQLAAVLLPALEGVSVEQLEADIVAFLATMAKDRLVVAGDEG